MSVRTRWGTKKFSGGRVVVMFSDWSRPHPHYRWKTVQTHHFSRAFWFDLEAAFSVESS